MELGFRIKQFIKYQWQAKTKYYIHSPFVYRFYLHVLEGETNQHIKSINKLRTNLKSDTTIIEAGGFGAGTNKRVSVAHLENRVSVPEKYGLLLHRLAAYFKPQTIIELGTCIGLGTAYLATGNTQAKVVSLEGSAALAGVARSNHNQLGLTNINIVTGDFADTLLPELNKLDKADMVYFDGNHRKQATLDYFNICLQKATENSVFVFDDIYWSRDMSEAWEEIKQHPRVTLTIDVYRFGICFFMPDKLAKEDFILRY